MKKNRISHLLPLLAVGLMLIYISGCSVLPNAYRIDIPQGNLLDQRKIEQLKIGMTPRQVQYLLGTPLVMDTLNQHRWDYFYSIKQGDNTSVKHHLTILFTQNRVSAIKDQLAQQ